jgi:phage head maturation protease
MRGARRERRWWLQEGEVVRRRGRSVSTIVDLKVTVVPAADVVQIGAIKRAPITYTRQGKEKKRKQGKRKQIHGIG